MERGQLEKHLQRPFSGDDIMSDSDFWKDHQFFLLHGKSPDEFTAQTLDLRKAKFYVEAHGGLRGPVFFPDLDTARQYRRTNRLTECYVAAVPMAEDGHFQTIVQTNGYNAIFCIYLVGATFRRDVTEFALSPVEDGQHRHQPKG
jgi:hypothetical protein